ncbi:hypothetical protein [Nocardioides sp.]|uniref:hypothetical protein n=1 Tax=Nocardioides sp. TaxID=35761 RepID=UPI002ED59CAF
MIGTPPPRATRRRLLGAPMAVVAAGIAVAGCDLVGAEGPGTSSTSPTPSGTPEATSTPAADPDEALVAQVRSEIAGTAGLVAAAGRGRPALRRELAPYRRLHDQHLAALPGDDPQVARTDVRGDAAAARRTVKRSERALQVQLADAAVGARSGPLAALLASMSAAVAQRLAFDQTVDSAVDKDRA